jgi:hypothetical protein
MKNELAALALAALTACDGTPVEHATAAQPTPMGEAVRAATDRSALRQGTVTAQSGERVRRLSLGTGFNHVAVSRVGPDGKVSVSCVDSAPAAEAFLSGDGAGASR